MGHCRLALDYLKSLNHDGQQKGYYFNAQLNGEESLYHTLEFTEGQQRLINELGERQYLKDLKKISTSITAPTSRFVPGLPRDSKIKWTRITLTRPIGREWVEAISIVLHITAKLEDSTHITVQGSGEAVGKAAEMFFRLQMFDELRSKMSRSRRKKPLRAADTPGFS